MEEWGLSLLCWVSHVLKASNLIISGDALNCRKPDPESPAFTRSGGIYLRLLGNSKSMPSTPSAVENNLAFASTLIIILRF